MKTITKIQVTPAVGSNISDHLEACQQLAKLCDCKIYTKFNNVKLTISKENDLKKLEMVYNYILKGEI